MGSQGKGHRRARAARRGAESGAIAVEFALVLPLLLLMIFGGLHLGRALGTKHAIAEATSYATRLGAINPAYRNAAALRQLIQNRLGNESPAPCANLTVRSEIIRVPNDPSRSEALHVTTRCALQPPLGGVFGVPFSPDAVSTESSFPIPKT